MAIMIRNLMILVLFFTAIPLYAGISFYRNDLVTSGEIKSGIQAKGICAIQGMNMEQSQMLALQRARASAIEQAVGAAGSNSYLVTNHNDATNFIKMYTKGFIISETISWLPLGAYQESPSTPPIPEYRVQVIASVCVPKKKSFSLTLNAKLNKAAFMSGQKANLSINTSRDSNIAVFNIRADDRVTLVFPNSHEENNIVTAGKEFFLPVKDADYELVMRPLLGHQKDVEAFVVIAWDRSRTISIRDLFDEEEQIGLNRYFRKMAEIDEYVEQVIIPYEVTVGR
jgi:hypothetical protein